MKKNICVNKVKKCMLIACLMCVLSSCQKDDKGIIEENTEEACTYEFGYDSRTAVIEGADGWVHYFTCEYEKDQSEPYAYLYNACNLKYKYLSDYVIEVYDAEGGFLYNAMPSVPELLLDEKCYNEIISTMSIIERMKPTEKLTQEQQNEIEVELLDKDILIKLFDKMIDSEKLEDGKYYYLPEADLLKEDFDAGYSWQIGYFNSHGIIMAVNIELIYEDEVYLSDIVENGIANEEQERINQLIESIEKEILFRQTFCIQEKLCDSETIDFTRLDKLLSEIEARGNANDNM